nr:truncated ORF10 protein [Severe acute respiratory syndrome coronavirus 2]QXJ00941.1 truncated ORF10 protein [Severe acute respiratory syndrome coronavirus 2]
MGYKRFRFSVYDI